MNLNFRNYYITLMLITTIVLLISLGVALYDFYNVFVAITQSTFQLNTANLYEVMTSTHIFQVGFVVILLNTVANYLKSRIGPEFKNAFTPNMSVIMLYLTGMTTIHLSGYLTMEYFFTSVIILMVFTIITFKKWSTELRLAHELKVKNPSIFEENEASNTTTRAEEKVEINPQVKLLTNKIVTKSLIENLYKDRKNVFSRPLSFLKSDFTYSLIVFASKDEKQRAKMKRLSVLGMVVRSMFVAQLTAVIIFYFQENHSLSFAISNLSAPLFWLMALLVLQFHYHASMMIYVSKEEFNNKVFLRKGIVYFALIGTLLCSMANPSFMVFGMSIFYFLSSFYLIKRLERAFGPALNTIFKGLVSDTTTAKK